MAYMYVCPRCRSIFKAKIQSNNKKCPKCSHEFMLDLMIDDEAWGTLTCDEKYEQAEKIYTQLLTSQTLTEDLLNYGYCLWLGGHVDEAADCFHRYLKETEQEKTFIIENELAMLREKGITEPEMQMMLYIL